ncbi:MAG TPA: hypothetical protein VMV75_09260 [Sulfuricella sp.]|jgi:hypothetical protein|nr:hypothetical protein [Gallionella sp.]HUW51188.1 hypothetical protein [Sulfuricella sp.]
MTDSVELNKQRDITFSVEPPGQVERAYQLLSGLPDCKIEYGDAPNTLRVSYNLYDYTLEGLENGLTQEGFCLDHSILHSIGREIVYYCEDTICHNLDIPVHPTKKNEREVFVEAYSHEPHGDYDDTPLELREYK